MQNGKRIAWVGLCLALLVCAASSAWARQRAATQPGEPAPATNKAVVRVVDRSGKPLSSAEVRIGVEGTIPRRMRSLPFPCEPPSSVVDTLLTGLPALHPDASEVPFVWRRGAALLVTARSEGLFGWGWFDGKTRASGGSDTISIELAPDWPLSVAVVDADGRPLEEKTVRLQASAHSLAMIGHGTDALVFAHAGYELRDEKEPCAVVFEGLFDPPVQLALDPERAPEAPLVLRLPPDGAVEVHVLAPRRTEDVYAVELQTVAERPASSAPSSGTNARQRVRTEDGNARFEHVPLGREFEVSVAGLGAGRSARVRAAGPTRAGATEHVVVTVEPASESSARPAGEPAGTLRGKLLFDPEVPAEQLELVLTSHSPEARSMPQDSSDGRWRFPEFETVCARDGSFAFSGLPLGPAVLDVRVAGGHIRQLELDVGPDSSLDPHLAALDLRGGKLVRTIAVRGVDPLHPFDARLLVEPLDSQTAILHYLHAWSAPIVIATPWDELDVHLFASGYRTIELSDLREDTEVELRPGIPVRLRLVTDGALPEPPRSLKAVLVTPQEPLRGLDWDGPAFDATHELVTSAGEPGQHLVEWIVAESSADRSSGGGQCFCTRTIDVLDSREEQTFELKLSAQELARMLARD